LPSNLEKHIDPPTEVAQFQMEPVGHGIHWARQTRGGPRLRLGDRSPPLQRGQVPRTIVQYSPLKMKCFVWWSTNVMFVIPPAAAAALMLASPLATIPKMDDAHAFPSLVPIAPFAFPSHATSVLIQPVAGVATAMQPATGASEVQSKDTVKNCLSTISPLRIQVDGEPATDRHPSIRGCRQLMISRDQIPPSAERQLHLKQVAALLESPESRCNRCQRQHVANMDWETRWCPRGGLCLA